MENLGDFLEHARAAHRNAAEHQELLSEIPDLANTHPFFMGETGAPVSAR